MQGNKQHTLFCCVSQHMLMCQYKHRIRMLAESHCKIICMSKYILCTKPEHGMGLKVKEKYRVTSEVHYF